MSRSGTDLECRGMCTGSEEMLQVAMFASHLCENRSAAGRNV